MFEAEGCTLYFFVVVNTLWNGISQYTHQTKKELLKKHIIMLPSQQIFFYLGDVVDKKLEGKHRLQFIVPLKAVKYSINRKLRHNPGGE